MTASDARAAPCVYVGTAGWNVPAGSASRFPTAGSHLERYAGRFNAVEINSSFYREHRPGTYARWREAVPAGFRFALKLPKEITHQRRLIDSADPVRRFVESAAPLAEKRGPLLVQLPPSLAFDAPVADAFFALTAAAWPGPLVCEPRHPTWFTSDADTLLIRHAVGRVAADPAVVPAAAGPGGALALTYVRLHGSPRMYYSDYSTDYIQSLAERIEGWRTEGREVWCIFDNTAEFAAAKNALDLLELLDKT